MEDRFTFLNADDDLLDEVLEGKPTKLGDQWPSLHNTYRLSPSNTGILALNSLENRPVALVTREDTAQRLFGRYANLRSDLSPLSAWCHVLEWDIFERLREPFRLPDLGNYAASWVGLSIAEALMLSERSVSNLKMAACLATQSYALARSLALWPMVSIENVLANYDACQKALRVSEASSTRLRSKLGKVWAALATISVSSAASAVSPDVRLLCECLVALQDTRSGGRPDEGGALYDVLWRIRAAEILPRLSALTPEKRVNEFDYIISCVEQAKGLEQEALFLLAGYVATVAAGGAPSLGLVENVVDRWPQIMAWAYVIGGIGEKVVWTSSFDGLGRLVARDLLRPFRFADPPSCDFAIGEAISLVDRGLKDPLVRLRVKQSRIVSVALYPGVNISIAIADVHAEPRRERGLSEAKGGGQNDGIAALADLIWPFIEKRLMARLSSRGPESNEGRRSSKTRSGRKTPRLPFPDN